MSVPFNDPFNPFYDQFSIHEADFTIPAHFSTYVPDNQDDYQCINVIVPSISKGASSWTYNDKWITIGIYRDEGRPTTQRPMLTGSTWTRAGHTVTITDPNGHKLHNGDLVDVNNINVQLVNVAVTVIDSYNFTVQGYVTGAISGNLPTYKDKFLTNFSENYRVFRLLPSFKLIPLTMLQQIFDTTKPVVPVAQKTIWSVNSNSYVVVPNGTSSSTNYELPAVNVSNQDLLPLLRRFGQVFDNFSNPLGLSYKNDGYPVNINNVDSRYKNKQIFYSVPIDGVSDPFIYAYDYYGLLMNDVSRGPLFSSSNVIQNLTVSGDMIINPLTGYVSTVNDLFGNLAIGVQSNNSLVIRKQILPLALDAFNLPVKNPSS